MEPERIELSQRGNPCGDRSRLASYPCRNILRVSHAVRAATLPSNSVPTHQVKPSQGAPKHRRKCDPPTAVFHFGNVAFAAEISLTCLRHRGTSSTSLCGTVTQVKDILPKSALARGERAIMVPIGAVAGPQEVAVAGIGRTGGEENAWHLCLGHSRGIDPKPWLLHCSRSSPTGAISSH